MTNTLIVDCSLKAAATDALLGAIGKLSEYTVIHFRDIDEGYQVEGNIDAVVLSGSAARIVNPFYRDMYQATANLVKNCKVPILGICYGHQLLCWTLGAKVGSLKQPVLDRFEKVHITESDEIFADLPQQQPALLAESHYDYVLKEGLSQSGFILLADSPSCEVEAVKHKHKPFYGVQFHPERIKIKNEAHADGNTIIQNYYKNVVRR